MNHYLDLGAGLVEYHHHSSLQYLALQNVYTTQNGATGALHQTNIDCDYGFGLSIILLPKFNTGAE